ncbi:helix-turn-helix domain-containing protein [Pontibacter chitinilyticus]|uniref:helix-turn-helix domain-containing protein n=1 Tax=Pontibacter chitinilyticus TaxID=2674989 RepID=UPI00321AB3DE
MAKPSPLYPSWQRLLAELGENIKFARLRRKLSAEQVAERAAISRPTLSQIEKGEPTVAMGNYLKVLAVLGLEKDLAQVGRDDKLGRKLQDAGLPLRARAPKHSSDT